MIDNHFPLVCQFKRESAHHHLPTAHATAVNHGPWPLALGPSRSPPRDHPAVVLSQTHPLYSGHAAAAWDPVRVPCSMLIILSDSITHSSNRIVRTIEHLIYTLDFLNQLPCVVLVVLVKCATPG